MNIMKNKNDAPKAMTFQYFILLSQRIWMPGCPINLNSQVAWDDERVCPNLLPKEKVFLYLIS